MDWITKFRQALLELDSAANEFFSSNPSAQEACDVLAEFHAMKGDFSIVYESVTHNVSETMGDLPEITCSNGATVEKRFGADRKAWKHKDLAAVVARRLSDLSIDLDTGERIMTSEDMVVKMLDFVQPSYWRIKELDKIGVAADKFCEVGESKESIIVRRAK
jgi:hypothetical protein